MQCTFLSCQVLSTASVPDGLGEGSRCRDKRAQVECVYVWYFLMVFSIVGGAVLRILQSGAVLIYGSCTLRAGSSPVTRISADMVMLRMYGTFGATSLASSTTYATRTSTAAASTTLLTTTRRCNSVVRQVCGLRRC
jgi:hypothetical protein